ncbi:hypothetical protein [Dysgonomonas sp. Marseille-P4361]|uniref:hypothetical protein n=1 Tax=Dysgonomonas sp. Marseille-P4361 TaxID=2161820 RepID=UPI000D55FC53|nr:hypothetical protein [Dysgonomonas sp. Marseille-P4361]
MKKLLLFIGLALFLFSCSEDDKEDKYAKDIVGYWVLDHISPTVKANSEANIQEVENFIREYGEPNSAWKFLDNGKVYTFSWTNDKDEWKYSINGNELTMVLTYDGEEQGGPITDRFEIREDKFIIYYDYLDWVKGNFSPDAGITEATAAIYYVRQ